MIKKLKSVFTKLIVLFLNTLGLSSFIACDGWINDVGGSVCMYGVPGNFFTVTGSITGDTDNNGTKEGVPNLKISVSTETSNAMNEHSENETLASINTDENGHYSLSWNDMDSKNFSFIFTIEDEDGEKNGTFETTSFEENYTALSKSAEKSSFGNLIIKTTKNIEL
ncbi:MAG: radical SAM-associated putative lipoprotein [Treponema sp.]|nr:radical SAM-associated putative lipoprotein [Treponema sp.]